MNGNHSSDDFGVLFGPSVDLSALAVAAYALVLTLRIDPDLAPKVDYSLEVAQKVLTFAALALILGSWIMLIKRASYKEVQPYELFFKVELPYTPMFWGIILVFASFLFLAFSGICQ